ncbi:putative prolyl-tRNA synthetase protein [Phialemonium atrogriseum]|uniref:Proline--tRNA ligase n=1 Tax=Phialemonium atrogriseum TaxID=1093897 RepID=A0AAJ0FQQ1_9PEZI|nr:putative prolyl-tRNA synthetase protein [Phialemonium atrogriseum]KAK1769395.1 putative prolyl-tRNA synthetase protein [Phialemonium atrogriseum]
MEDAQGPSKSALKKAEKQAKMAAAKAEKAAARATTVPIVGGGGAKKGDESKEIIGMTVSKEVNFSQWYHDLVIKAELVEYYSEISGFFILRPAAMHIWNVIRAWFQERIQDMGVEETNFPMFLSSKSLEKEKEHVEGFAPELAWVTKAGDKDLEVPVAVRPTSEAVMYPYYSKWIRSHRDLPFRLNQWNSVVRWEAKQTTPFLRTREFLWQEGHTAHLSEALAEKEVLEILELYAGVYEQLLAVPVVRGKKTENEKFAGGYWTSTCEAYIPTNGRGIQGATSHKMFDITVEDPEKKGEKIFVWQNSWGLSTRVIGVMVMLHGDDKGLVLPPRVTKIQAILIPVGLTAKMNPEDRANHMKQVDELRASLRKAKVRVEIDDRDGYFETSTANRIVNTSTPGFKFADWEMKGIPLRLEFGPKDAAASVVTYARRDTGSKGTIPIAELATQVPALLETIQQDMYNKADASFKSHRLILRDWAQVVPALDSRNVVLIPFCEEPACEERIKELTKSDENQELGPDGLRQPSMGMKSLCIPFEQPDGLVQGETKCLNPECERLAKSWVMFGRSY